MREVPYIILVLLVIIAAALFLGNSDPISAATGRAEASAVLSKVPAGGWVASQFIGALFNIVLSGVVLGVAGVVVAQVRKWLRDRQYQQQRWRSGPNAQWQTKAPKQPKPMNVNQMMQWAMIQRLTPPPANAQPAPPYIISQQVQPEENLDLHF
ncbi:MAG: hypothetical protein L3J16_01030 [Anaerolineales bacterium]|nr:hypothetical protein [Anaerolineales bacterium]